MLLLRSERLHRLLKVVWMDAETIRKLHRMRVWPIAVRKILRILVRSGSSAIVHAHAGCELLVRTVSGTVFETTAHSLLHGNGRHGRARLIGGCGIVSRRRMLLLLKLRRELLVMRLLLLLHILLGEHSCAVVGALGEALEERVELWGAD